MIAAARTTLIACVALALLLASLRRRPASRGEVIRFPEAAARRAA